MTLWIVMPAYNEGPRLLPLLERWVGVMQQLGAVHRYVIVDDGSRDETPDILRDFASRHRVDIINHPSNEGLGVSLRDALRYVADRSAEEDLITAMDADNTQPPELLPAMMERMNESECDVVIASRYRPGARVTGLSGCRRVMSFGARVLFQTMFPIRGVRDYTCGYRLYRASMIRRAFEVFGERFCDRAGFECTADILLRLARLGARFDEVALELSYSAKGDQSHMRVGQTLRRTLGLMLQRRFEPSP